MKEKLSIVHINTHDVAGGAAKVAWRLAESQRGAGHNSNMLVGNKMSYSKHSFAFATEPDMFIQDQCRRKGQIDYEFQGSHSLIKNLLVQSADILHLHNLHGSYFNPFSLSALSHIKPVVWTLHDMCSITGHCAHSFNCNKWQHSCGNCPYLNVTYPIPVDTSAQLLEDKRLIYNHSYLQIIVPSLWLKNKVERSVLGNHPVELIYNGIDTNTFKPYDKKESRRILGVPADAFVVGAVAHGGALQNQWKGGHYSQEALDMLRGRLDDCVFVNIGSDYESKDRQIINIPDISDENELAQAYSALDVFLYTPIADNCPLVVIESLACGVPIVTFDTGGVPELVRDGRDGYVLGFRDVLGLVQSLEKLAKNRNLCNDFSCNARQWAVSKFEHKLVSEQYMDLYQRCLQETRSKPKEMKLFPLEKVPKVIVSEAFLRAEDAKRAVQHKHESCKNGGVKTSGITDRVIGSELRRISPAERCKQAQKGEYLISAIVSTYNSERFIRGCLDDLERQTIADKIEIIVVNSGSQQNEETIVREYQQKYDNIRYIKTENCETIYKAWNHGIEMAHGKYIANANTDDRRRQNAMETMVRVLEENPDVGLVYADQILTYRENETFEDNTLSEEYTYPDYKPDIFLEIGYCKIGSQPMWRASVHKEAGLFDDNFEIAGDYDFLLRVCDRYKCFHIQEFLGAFYRSAGSVSRKKSFRLNEVENPVAKARALLRKGIKCIEEKDYTSAIRHLGFSLRHWSSREAAQYLKTASEKQGCRSLVGDEEIGRLPSIYELPGSKSKSDVRQLVLDKGQWTANGKDVVISAIIYPDLGGTSYDCLEELEKQTITNLLEVIVIGKKSNLDDEITLERFQQKYGSIKFVDLSDTETIGTALNRAIKVASGRYIALLSNRYHYRPNSLELMVKALDSDNRSVALYIKEKENLQSKAGEMFIQGEVAFSYDRLLQGNLIELPVLWHRSLHEHIGYFDEVFVSAGCYEFWLRAAQRCGFMCLDLELKNAEQRQNDIGDEDKFADSFETAVIQKSYQYAYLNSILIGNGGISQTKPFSDWCETNIIKKRTEGRLSNRGIDPIERLYEVGKADKTPLLSVIVVTYNREADLFENIKALNEQTETNFELVVVNNGRVVQQFGQNAGSLNFNLCYIELKSNYGPSLGRNIGAKFAKASYVAFLDDDAIADKDFVRNIVRHFKEYDICGLRGKVLSKMGNCNSSFLNLGEEIVHSTIECEGNCAFRKDVFLRYNGFDEYLFHGEGVDLAYRIYKGEGENLGVVLYFPDVIIYHDSYVMSHDNTERIARTSTVGKLLFQKDGGIALYLSYFNSFYPECRQEVEGSRVRMMNNVSFLDRRHPEQAVVWAQKAAKLNPEAFTCRYILGRLYIRLEEYNQAEVTFRGLFEEIADALAEGNLKLLKSNFKDATSVGMCYCDSGLKLAYCYTKQNKINSAKCVYEELLKEKYISMSEEQKVGIHTELSKLDNGLYSSVIEENKDVVTAADETQRQCDVSIVLCTKNRAKLLDQMLTSLKEAVEGVSYELIAVEGGSTDNTVEILRKHGVTEIYNESECIGQGRHSWPQLYNFGFSKVRGKWGMFASDDIIFGKGCITNAVKCLNQRGSEIAGGVFFFKNVYESSHLEEFVRWKFFIGMGLDYRILMNYGLVRLDCFREVKGFDEAYQFYYADSDLCSKLYDSGSQLIPLPQCFVIHNNVQDTLKQTNSLNGEHDIEMYCQRWRHFLDAEGARVARLVWHEDLVDAFNLPADLPKVECGFAYFWQGIAYFQREMFEEAMEKFAGAMEKGCSHWRVLWYSGQAACSCGETKFAEKAVRIVTKLAPQFAKAREFLAKLSKSDPSLPAFQQFKQPTSEKSVSYLSSSKQVSRTGGLIFSKDRAMQLEAVIESFLMHCRDNSLIELNVLYKTSSHLHEQQYNRLKERFPNVSFVKEVDFKQQVQAIILKFGHILFLVDDNLFVRDFYFADVIESLHTNDKVIGFSLRLGKNTGYCYTRYAEQSLPVFQQLNNGILKFDWTKAEHDFGYPFEVSSSVYRTRNILELISRIDFGNPNTLEGLMAVNSHSYRSARSELLCYECSVAFCNPVNMVQTVWDNRVKQDGRFSADSLAEMFEKGLRIDVGRYCDFVSSSCHQEVQLYFKETGLKSVGRVEHKGLSSHNQESNFLGEKTVPLVSVTMVAYNSQRFIRQAIDSVLAQTYDNFELLIVDDGSTDGTGDIVASYSDKRIRYIHTTHKNYAAGKNMATAEAKGEYLLCVDSDDFIAEDYIEKIVNFAEQYPEVDYFYPAKLTLADESGDYTEAEWEYLDFSDNKALVSFLFNEGYSPIPNPGGLKRKLLFDRVGGYEELETVEDFAFLCKNASKIRFKRVDTHSKYFYRRLPNSLSHNFKERDQITARILNEMVGIYRPEELCPMVAGIADADLKKRRYYGHLAETFYKHARGYHMVQYGEYFKYYGDYYKEKLLSLG